MHIPCMPAIDVPLLGNALEAHERANLLHEEASHEFAFEERTADSETPYACIADGAPAPGDPARSS